MAARSQTTHRLPNEEGFTPPPADGSGVCRDPSVLSRVARPSAEESSLSFLVDASASHGPRAPSCLYHHTTLSVLVCRECVMDTEGEWTAHLGWPTRCGKTRIAPSCQL